MNLEQFKTNVIEAMEAASVVVDAQFREANTVSEIISLMSALWLKELPGNLSVQMRDLGYNICLVHDLFLYSQMKRNEYGQIGTEKT